jgi:hypothetical protein
MNSFFAMTINKEILMKSLIVLMVVAGSLLAGCVVEDSRYGYRDGLRYSSDRDRDGVPNRADRDRDGDGVRNSQDRRPDDPRRY